MTTPNFGELLAKYMQRAGISDSELARTIGVQRQTIFRWKEGIVARPRVREDVLRCASKLRLTHEERDQLLLAAGFPPEVLPTPAANAEPPASAPEPLIGSAPPDLAAQLEPPAAEQKMAAARPRPWLWWASVALAGLLLGLGWLAWAGRFAPADLGVTPSSINNPLVFGEPIAFTDATPKLTATRAPSASAAISTTIPPVLIPWPTASPSEMLLVVAPFTGYSAAQFDVAGRIEEKLQEQIEGFSLTNTFVRIWSSPLSDKVAAGQVLSATQATIVIWGAYDDGRVQVNWFVRAAEKAEKSDFSLTPPKDLIVTINENVPNEMQSVALYTFGRLFQSQGNVEKAERAYLQGLALNPSNDRLAALLNFYVGRIVSVEKKAETPAQQINNYDKALAYYASAYRRNPRLHNALYNRGTVWLFRTLVLTETTAITPSLTAAITDLTDLLAQKPAFADAYFNRGLAYYHRNQPDDPIKAVADFTQVIALKPQEQAGWYQRALAHIRLGNDLAWTRDLTHTLQLSPTYHATYDAFCWGYALAQQPNAALPYCTKALTLQDPPDPNRTSHDALGIVYAQLGRYAEAVAELEKYLRWIQAYHPQEYSKRRGPEVANWIATLKLQKNPFDAQTLAHLR